MSGDVRPLSDSKNSFAASYCEGMKPSLKSPRTIFGGATRHIVTEATVPVLLAH